MPVQPDLARKLAAVAAAAVKSTAERDRLIVEAYQAGGSLREIARLAGLSHPGVLRIVRRDAP
jgi:hypothetical protein